MKKIIDTQKLLFIPLACALFTGCKKDEEKIPASVVSFLETSQTRSENMASGSAIIKLDRALKTDLAVTVEISGTAKKGSDFTMVSTENVVVIPAGQTALNYNFQVTDDKLTETENETVVFTLKAVDQTTAQLSATASSLTYTYTITDNDAPAAPTSGVAIDLNWIASSTADLDLYIMKGGSEYASATYVDRFERLTIPSAEPDGQYEIYAEYYGGSGEVEYSTTITPATGSAKSFIRTFRAADKGTTKKILTLTKTGSSYTITETPAARVAASNVKFSGKK